MHVVKKISSNYLGSAQQFNHVQIVAHGRFLRQFWLAIVCCILFFGPTSSASLAVFSLVIYILICWFCSVLHNS